MNQTASRVIFVLEAVFIMLPMSWLFVWIIPSDRAVLDPMFGARQSAAFILIAAALLCGWYLSLKFAFQGRSGLGGTSMLWWVAPAIAAVIGVGGLLWLFIMGRHDLSVDVGFYFVLGIPLLLPLAHLWLERWPFKRRP